MPFVNPNLERFVDVLLPSRTSRAGSAALSTVSAPGPSTRPRLLVPLCGKTLDLRYLADLGADVVGVDGVREAFEEWAVENKTALRPGPTVAGFEIFTAPVPKGSVSLFLGDFLGKIG